ncbi:MAG TPA: deoxyhypusine synthase [Candidatus Paceibacterota bacterium]|nr:deoxyhypusine synthase [Candidatus Paceibacterota bacterium]
MTKNNSNKEQEARKNILRRSEEAEGISIKGYDFNKGVNYENLIDSYSTTGFQATNLAKAIEIIDEMRKNNAYIYLGYTSNLVSSGLRDIFRYLAEHKMVDVIVTTAGGIEEDFVKCLGNFKLGAFNLKGSNLRDKGINRTGNILVPNSRYCDFEDFVMPILKKLNEKAEKERKATTVSDLIKTLSKEINNKESIYYWAYKNEIPVFCPAITDGSLGDMIYFFKTNHPEFELDISNEILELNNTTIGKNKTGIIILGGGIIKHSICNANMYRNGADYAVYINSNPEFDGSDSGANPDEAISWGKINQNAKSVKVFGDATIIFPLIAAKCFTKKINH